MELIRRVAVTIAALAAGGVLPACAIMADPRGASLTVPSKAAGTASLKPSPKPRIPLGPQLRKVFRPRKPERPRVRGSYGEEGHPRHRPSTALRRLSDQGHRDRGQPASDGHAGRRQRQGRLHRRRQLRPGRPGHRHPRQQCPRLQRRSSSRWTTLKVTIKDSSLHNNPSDEFFTAGWFRTQIWSEVDVLDVQVVGKSGRMLRAGGVDHC